MGLLLQASLLKPVSGSNDLTRAWVDPEAFPFVAALGALPFPCIDCHFDLVQGQRRLRVDVDAIFPRRGLFVRRW